MQVHALDALLGAHADDRRLRRVQHQLALGDEAQVSAADLELRLHDLEGALIVGLRLGQDPFAIAPAISADSAFSTSLNALSPTAAYAAMACFCSAVRISTWAFSAPPL